MSTLMLEKLEETKDPEETKKPEDNKKPGKNDDYFFDFAYLNNKLNKKDKPCKMNAKVRKQYYELKKAYHRNLVISKSAKYLLENAPKTVRPVKSKLEKQLALAENLRDQALKYLTELENCYE